jgi:hypothetical protein
LWIAFTEPRGPVRARDHPDGASLSHRGDMFLSIRLTVRIRRINPPVTRLVFDDNNDPGGVS